MSISISIAIGDGTETRSNMYAAYDIRRQIFDSEFFSPSHLYMVVYMYPTPICDIRRPMCDGDFFDLGPKKLDNKCILVNVDRILGRLKKIRYRKSAVVSSIHVDRLICLSANI